MSWNWKEEMEEKEYEVKGTVTISTEEYRDLISEVYDLHSRGQKEHDDWYKEYIRANELEKKNTSLENKIKEYEYFINSDDVLKEKLKSWRLEQMLEKEENAENV